MIGGLCFSMFGTCDMGRINWDWRAFSAAVSLPAAPGSLSYHTHHKHVHRWAKKGSTARSVAPWQEDRTGHLTVVLASEKVGDREFFVQSISLGERRNGKI